MNSKKFIYTGLTTISVILVFVMFTAVASAAPPEITSFAPPSPVYDHTCALRTFNVTLDQTANVNWYLDDRFLFTDVSVTEAECSFEPYVTGEHNVSAIAANQNGTDMQTWIWNAAGCGGGITYVHHYLYRDEEKRIEDIHRTVAGYAHDDLGPSFYSNDWDIWHVGSWSDLTAGEIAYLDTVTGLSAGIWYYIDLLNQTVATTPFENYTEEIGSEETEEINYEQLDPYTVLVTHIITTTVTYKDVTYQLIVKVEDVTTGAPNISSFAPPSPVYDGPCVWRAFNVTLDQTANVNWYLDDSLLFTNVSVTEAKCSISTYVTGVHNVTAIAANPNGMAMQTWIWNVDGTTCHEIHKYWYQDEEVHIDENHRTVAGYAHDDLGPSFYSNDWDIWHVGSWSDLTAGEIAYLDTVTGLSAGIWYYIDLLNQTVATTPFENYTEEIGSEETEEIIYECLDVRTVLVTHIITTTVTYKDHIYQLIVKVEDDTEGAVPYVVSSDYTGKERNTFELTEDVYCYAGNIPAGDVRIYVVANKDVWTDGDGLTDVSGGNETRTTESDGSIATTKIWSATLTQGDYDIVVDTNQNGEWNTGEPIDSEVDVGLSAVPEFTTIAIPVAAVLGLVFLMSRRSRRSRRRN